MEVYAPSTMIPWFGVAQNSCEQRTGEGDADGVEGRSLRDVRRRRNPHLLLRVECYFPTRIPLSILRWTCATTRRIFQILGFG